jgi:hypothetical protein
MGIKDKRYYNIIGESIWYTWKYKGVFKEIIKIY